MIKLITEEPSQAYEEVRQFEFEQFFQCIYQCGNYCTNRIGKSIKTAKITILIRTTIIFVRMLLHGLGLSQSSILHQNSSSMWILV